MFGRGPGAFIEALLWMMGLQALVGAQEADHAAGVDEAVNVADRQDRSGAQREQVGLEPAFLGIGQIDDVAAIGSDDAFEAPDCDGTLTDPAAGDVGQAEAARVVAEEADRQRGIAGREGGGRPLDIAREIEDEGRTRLVLGQGHLGGGDAGDQAETAGQDRDQSLQHDRQTGVRTPTWR